MVKNPSAYAVDIRDAGSIPRLGTSPGEGHGNPLQYSCLEMLIKQIHLEGSLRHESHLLRKNGDLC